MILIGRIPCFLQLLTAPRGFPAPRSFLLIGSHGHTGLSYVSHVYKSRGAVSNVPLITFSDLYMCAREKTHARFGAVLDNAAGRMPPRGPANIRHANHARNVRRTRASASLAFFHFDARSTSTRYCNRLFGVERAVVVRCILPISSSTSIHSGFHITRNTNIAIQIPDSRCWAARGSSVELCQPSRRAANLGRMWHVYAISRGVPRSRARILELCCARCNHSDEHTSAVAHT
jgi:hypothetical protein